MAIHEVERKTSGLTFLRFAVTSSGQEPQLLRSKLRQLMHQHFLIVGKDVLQSAVVGSWLAGANEAYFFRFSGRGYADALRAYRRLFFTVVIIEDLILVAVDIETDLREVNLI